MSNWYITFKKEDIHGLPCGIFDSNTLAEVEADNEEEANSIAKEYFDDEYYSVYPASQCRMIFMRYYPRGVIKLC